MSQLFTSGGQKYWIFTFSISPSDEYSGLVSFRIDWFDLLAVQRTLKSLLQHHNSKSSILQHSAFFMGSRGKNLGVVCHSLLQGTMFCQDSSLCPIHLWWPCRVWFIDSLSYANPLAMIRLWSMKGVFSTRTLIFLQQREICNLFICSNLKLYKAVW